MNHNWTRKKLGTGEYTSYSNCHCQIHHQLNHIKVYKAAGTTVWVNQRPPCRPPLAH
jgi:hypothetical protein